MEIKGCILHTTSPASWASRTPTTPWPPRAPPPHACVTSATTPERRQSRGCGHGGRSSTTGSTRLLILECCVALVTLTIYPLEYLFWLVFFTVVLLLSVLWSPLLGSSDSGLSVLGYVFHPRRFSSLINEVVTALSLRFIPPNSLSKCFPIRHLNASLV